MKLPLFLYLHTLFFDKLPLHLTVSPIHQIWPSPTVSFISPQEVLSQLIFKFLSCLPSPPSLWLYTLGKRQDCKPAAAVLTSAGDSGPTENAMWWGPGHTLHPSQLYHSMAPSYPTVTRHIYQPLVFIAAPHKKQVPTSWFRITLHTPQDILQDPSGRWGLQREQVKYPLYLLRREKGKGTRCLMEYFMNSAH